MTQKVKRKDEKLERDVRESKKQRTCEQKIPTKIEVSNDVGSEFERVKIDWVNRLIICLKVD